MAMLMRMMIMVMTQVAMVIGDSDDEDGCLEQASTPLKPAPQTPCQEVGMHSLHLPIQRKHTQHHHPPVFNIMTKTYPSPPTNDSPLPTHDPRPPTHDPPPPTTDPPPPTNQLPPSSANCEEMYLPPPSSI
ncbi:hypothetical protein PoB_000509300 [Plakobranchus ocellatus]|uniref:Uncharacterized protein n=1 Tax=Plakobranchus ocellatus TaxID=259542 RepID=A0AAV3Y7V8_9GAST|nr:hypothetical protein PoB_000509300 [Plakobranchus ocellatus]